MAADTSIAILIVPLLPFLSAQERGSIQRLPGRSESTMTEFVLFISLLSNAFTLFILKMVSKVYAQQMIKFEKDLEILSLEVRMIK